MSIDLEIEGQGLSTLLKISSRISFVEIHVSAKNNASRTSHLFSPNHGAGCMDGRTHMDIHWNVADVSLEYYTNYSFHLNSTYLVIIAN